MGLSVVLSHSVITLTFRVQLQLLVYLLTILNYSGFHVTA